MPRVCGCSEEEVQSSNFFPTNTMSEQSNQKTSHCVKEGLEQEVEYVVDSSGYCTMKMEQQLVQSVDEQ